MEILGSDSNHHGNAGNAFERPDRQQLHETAFETRTSGAHDVEVESSMAHLLGLGGDEVLA